MPRYGQPIQYDPIFEEWWNTNKALFDAELNRRLAAIPTPDNDDDDDQDEDDEVDDELAQTPQIIAEDLKTDVYREAFLGIAANALYDIHGANLLNPNHPLPTNAEIAAKITKTKFVFSARNGSNVQIDTNPGSVATRISVDYEDRQNAFNEDAYFLKQYPGLEKGTSNEIKLTLLKIFMEMASSTDQTEEGAVCTMVFVGTDGIYVLNVGDSPVYLTEFNTNPSLDKTTLISRIHDAKEDQHEVQHAIARGGVIIDRPNVFNIPDPRIGYDPTTQSSMFQPTRAFGDRVFPGLFGKTHVFGMSIVPTLTKIPFEKPDGTRLNLNDLKLTVCSDGISKVFDPSDIGIIARRTREMKKKNISNTLVNAAYRYARDDVTAIDVNLNCGNFAVVLDGHGIQGKARQNRVVKTVLDTIDASFRKNGSETINTRRNSNNNNNNNTERDERLKVKPAIRKSRKPKK